MGVISDTSPSLALTLEAARIGEYFDCAICSDLVGVMKPNCAIYQAALVALGVTAAESVYVDDYDVEADGARDMGFTLTAAGRGTESGESTRCWRLKPIWSKFSDSLSSVYYPSCSEPHMVHISYGNLPRQSQ